MSGTESGLFTTLGFWFLLITFFITIGVAIKVLLGGSSGSKPERHDNMQDMTEVSLAHGKSDVEKYQHQSSDPDK